MNRCIALLRGINVGGHQKIKMDDLKGMLESLGFEKIDTYIQSGNVVFDATIDDRDHLRTVIKEQIESEFGFHVPVLIRTPRELETALNDFPLEILEGWKGYISFLMQIPDEKKAAELEAKSNEAEQFKVKYNLVYSIVDKKTEVKTRFSNGFIEKKLSITATTRNLRTCKKILDLSLV